MAAYNPPVIEARAEFLVGVVQKYFGELGFQPPLEQSITALGSLYVVRDYHQCTSDSVHCKKYEAAYPSGTANGGVVTKELDMSTRARGDCPRVLPDVELVYPLMCASVPIMRAGATLDIEGLARADEVETYSENRLVRRALYHGRLWISQGVAGTLGRPVCVEVVSHSGVDLTQALVHSAVEMQLREAGAYLKACSPYVRVGRPRGGDGSSIANWMIPVADVGYATFRLREHATATMARLVDERVDAVIRKGTDKPGWKNRLGVLMDQLTTCIRARAAVIGAEVNKVLDADPSLAQNVYMAVPRDAEDYVVTVDSATNFPISVELDCWRVGNVEKLTDTIRRETSDGAVRRGMAISRAPTLEEKRRPAAFYEYYIVAQFAHLMHARMENAVRRAMFDELDNIGKDADMRKLEYMRSIVTEFLAPRDAEITSGAVERPEAVYGTVNGIQQYVV